MNDKLFIKNNDTNLKDLVCIIRQNKILFFSIPTIIFLSTLIFNIICTFIPQEKTPLPNFYKSNIVLKTNNIPPELINNYIDSFDLEKIITKKSIKTTKEIEKFFKITYISNTISISVKTRDKIITDNVIDSALKYFLDKNPNIQFDGLKNDVQLKPHKIKWTIIITLCSFVLSIIIVLIKDIISSKK